MKNLFSKDLRALRIAAAVLALYASAAFVAERKIDYSGFIATRYPGNFPAPFELIDGLVFLVLAVALWFLILFVASALASCIARLDEWRSKRVRRFGKHERGEREAFDASRPFPSYLRSRKKTAILVGLVVFACWLAVWAAYYPGSSMNDQLLVVEDPIYYLSIHPPLYVFFLWAFVTASNALFSTGNVGFAVFTLCQMVVASSCVALCASWLRCRGVPKVACALFVAFFAVAPIVSDYAMTPIKDTLFSYSFLLIIPLLYGFVSNREGFWQEKWHAAAFFALALAMGLTRSNGVYVVIVLAVVLAFLSWGKAHFSRFVAAAVLAVALSFAPSVVCDAVFDSPHLFRETISIPLQQIAAVISADGTIPEQDAAVVDQMMIREAVPRAYSPVFVDTVKLKFEEKVIDDEYIQQHRGEIMKAWFSIGLANPDLYLRAWLAQTYGCWAPLSHNADQSVFFGLASNDPQDPVTLRLVEKHKLTNSSLYPAAPSEVITAIYPKLTRCLPTGCLFLVDLLLAFAIAWRRKDVRYLVVALPLVLLWGTLMLSVPLSGAFRYGFAMLLSAPMLALALLIPQRGRMAE